VRPYASGALEYLAQFLQSYLIENAESAMPSSPQFYRVVREVNLVYGKRRGELFERELEDKEAFEKLVASLETELGELRRRGERELATRVLARIDRGEVFVF
jgi:uncharacterized protein Yka (UPF0111/DUF47 family)